MRSFLVRGFILWPVLVLLTSPTFAQESSAPSIPTAPASGQPLAATDAAQVPSSVASDPVATQPVPPALPEIPAPFSPMPEVLNPTSAAEEIPLSESPVARSLLTNPNALASNAPGQDPNAVPAAVQATQDVTQLIPPLPSSEPAPPILNPLSAPAASAPDRAAGEKKWRIRPSFAVGVTYDDNVFITRSNRQSDEIFNLSGGLALEVGDYRNLQENYLLANYRLDGFVFVRNGGEDAINQAASLYTQFRFSRLTLRTETQYTYTTGADQQVGNYVDRHYLTNTFRLLDDLSPKTQVFLSFQQTANLYASYLNSLEFILRAGADYAVTPKAKLGAEVALGAVDQESSPFSVYGQLRLRLNYDWTEKFSLQVSAGGEVRSYRGAGSTATPVFSLGASWRPFVDTSVGLTGYRQVNASALYTNTNFVGTGVAVQATQLLFRRLTAGVAIGFENDSYGSDGSVTSLGSNREDNYFYARPTLAYRLNDWISATFSYEFRRNASNNSAFSFSENRFSCGLGFTF